ncbi:hypothetical protein ADT35_06875, partial [Yersinia pestis subsp. microtus bv. Talassica]
MTITATWKHDSSKVFTYDFTLNYWVGLYSSTNLSWAQANASCINAGMRLPTNREVSAGQDVRGVGSLFGEW